MASWKKRWGYLMSEKPIRPGIYRLKDGGHYVRSKLTDKRSGHRKEVSAVLSDVKTPTEAQRRLDELVADARAEMRGEIRQRTSWGSFAISRLKERRQRNKVASAATFERWKEAIGLFAPEWGDLDVREVTRHHIDRWLSTKVASWMTEGKTVIRKRRQGKELVDVPVTTVIKPTTVNGWLRVLRAICHAAKVKFDLPKSAFEGVEFFEEGRIYTREAPNALPPDKLPTFMAIARKKFPQHYAMIFLGMATGLRPSSMRPLRRKGPASDIDWETGILQVRRSHSRGQAIMEKTKTGKDNTIALPPEVLDELRRHADALEGKMAESDLLFPSDKGTLRTRNVLAKPFAAIAKAMGLSFKLTPRGMRRTFNDAARAVGIRDVVTRSISGHATETMQHHYSTARDDEQRDALSKVSAAVAGPKEAR